MAVKGVSDMKNWKRYFCLLVSVFMITTTYADEQEEETAPKIDQMMTIELAPQSAVLKIRADVATQHIQRLKEDLKLTLHEPPQPLDCTLLVDFPSMDKIEARWQSGSKTTTTFKVDYNGKTLDGTVTTKIIAAPWRDHKFWALVQVETKTELSTVMFAYGFYARTIPDGKTFRIAITELIPKDMSPFAIVAGKSQAVEETKAP